MWYVHSQVFKFMTASGNDGEDTEEKFRWWRIQMHNYSYIAKYGKLFSKDVIVNLVNKTHSLN